MNKKHGNVPMLHLLYNKTAGNSHSYNQMADDIVTIIYEEGEKISHNIILGDSFQSVPITTKDENISKTIIKIKSIPFVSNSIKENIDYVF